MNAEIYKRKDGLGAAFLVSAIIIAWIYGVIVNINFFIHQDSIFWTSAFFIISGVSFYILYKHVIICDQHEKIDEFLIYEYEIWDVFSLDYKKKYIVDVISTKSKFIYNKFIKTYHIGNLDPQIYRSDTISIPTEKDITNYIWADINREYSDKKGPGFNTNEDAMNYIYNYAKEAISSLKETQGIKIRNINMYCHTIDEIILKLEEDKKIDPEGDNYGK